LLSTNPLLPIYLHTGLWSWLCQVSKERDRTQIHQARSGACLYVPSRLGPDLRGP